jgi:hypothetical protein
MCAIAAIPALIGLGISIASTATATGLQAGAASKAGAAEAETAERNARLARAQRNAEIQRGGYEARRVEAEGRRVGAAAVTQVAKSGISTTSGSAAGAPLVSAMNAQADADRIRAAAARQAWGYETQQVDYRARAREARRAGFLGALSSGISGGAQIGQAVVSSPAWGYVG